MEIFGIVLAIAIFAVLAALLVRAHGTAEEGPPAQRHGDPRGGPDHDDSKLVGQGAEMQGLN